MFPSSLRGPPLHCREIDTTDSYFAKPSQDSNRGPPDHRARAIPLDHGDPPKAELIVS